MFSIGTCVNAIIGRMYFCANITQGEVLELTLSHIMSPASYAHILNQYFAHKIYKRRNSRVKIKMYSAGMLNDTKLSLDVVKTGVANMVRHSTS